METQAALVGADGGVELHAVAAVDMDNAVVVRPGHAELDHALRLNKALKQTVLLPLGVLIHNQLQRLKNLSDSLQELRLMPVALLHLSVDPLQIIVCQHNDLLLNICILPLPTKLWAS